MNKLDLNFRSVKLNIGEMSKKDNWYMENHNEMVGTSVLVLNKNGNWRGTVVSAVDDEYFLVNDGREDRKVSMFHLRTEEY